MYCGAEACSLLQHRLGGAGCILHSMVVQSVRKQRYPGSTGRQGACAACFGMAIQARGARFKNIHGGKLTMLHGQGGQHSHSRG